MKLLEAFKLNENQLASFAKYKELLLEWNKKFNLTAITDEDEIEEKHFVDSLMLLNFVSLDNKSLLDVGSGAGFPGIPLAIACPKAKITLLESNGKKVTFLKEVVSQLKLNNVEIVQSRSEEFNKREQFDYVTARAVKELNILLEICFHLVKVGGAFIAYKSSNIDNEIENAKKAFRELEIGKIEKYSYNLPNSQDIRVLLELFKKKPTKKKYPRQYSEIVKAPLR